jgi:hypothetical protein
MADVAEIDAAEVFPPLTGNEARVLRALESDSARELSAEAIAERSGLSLQSAERSLASLRSRRPPLVDESARNGDAQVWQPPATYSLAIVRG